MAKLTDVKQKTALKNVLKKLSALRLTLRKDERAILDQFVLGMSAEVAGHRYGADLLARTDGAKHASRKSAGAKAEVAGHRYGADLTAKTDGTKFAGAKYDKANKTLSSQTEVIGHRYGADLAAKTDGTKFAGVSIIFNAQAGAYQVLD